MKASEAQRLMDCLVSNTELMNLFGDSYGGMDVKEMFTRFQESLKNYAADYEFETLETMTEEEMRKMESLRLKCEGTAQYFERVPLESAEKAAIKAAREYRDCQKMMLDKYGSFDQYDPDQGTFVSVDDLPF